MRAPKEGGGVISPGKHSSGGRKTKMESPAPTFPSWGSAAGGKLATSSRGRSKKEQPGLLEHLGRPPGLAVGDQGHE